MTRRESREQAFALLFEMMFNDQPVEELAAAASEARVSILITQPL